MQQHAQSREALEHVVYMVEQRSAVKTFFIGVDNTHLDHLRSEVAHMHNRMMHLEHVQSQVQADEDRAVLQEHMHTIQQDQERIRAIITENEYAFSLFGWVCNFFHRI